MRNNLNVLSVLTSVLLMFSVFGVQSCGSAQQAGDEILRVGGISSTGNKDEDEDGTTGGTAKQEQPQSMPIPGNSALVCDQPVDLSGRKYAYLAQPDDELRECTDDQRTFACVDDIVFSTKEDATIRYRMSGGEILSIVATYRMCDLDLAVWTVDAGGGSSIDAFKSSADVQILTHGESGRMFQLVP